MPVEHPSMRRTKPNPRKQPKRENYVVENATQPQAAIEPQEVPAPIPQHVLTGAPQETVNKPEYQTPDLIPERKVQLEDLIFLGLMKKEIEIGSMTFEISTLSHDENTELMKSLYTIEGGADLFTIRTMTLAYAIRKINGIPFEEVDMDEEFEDPYDKKVAILNKMQKGVVEKIHDDFVDLAEESDNKLTGEEVKN